LRDLVGGFVSDHESVGKEFVGAVPPHKNLQNILSGEAELELRVAVETHAFEECRVGDQAIMTAIVRFPIAFFDLFDLGLLRVVQPAYTPGIGAAS
jgi:hypothetical protein